MTQFYDGYQEAITQILCHIEFRRKTYKQQDEIDKYKALDMLYEEIKLIFNQDKDINK